MKNKKEKEVKQNEKQKNSMIFECHYVPKTLEPRINEFLKALLHNDIFLLHAEKFPDINFIEVNFISDMKIQKLNSKFRKINKPTDVLSFNLHLIAEIDISLDQIKYNCKSLALDLYEEIERCLIHGCLHIFGFDHTEKLTVLTITSEPMFLIQEKILQQCHIK